MSIKEAFVKDIHTLQNDICSALETQESGVVFEQDNWQRPGGGGGKTRVIRDGEVFEKGGVNTSVVHGKLPAMMKERFNVDNDDFFACGLSLVIHPQSPLIPTVHANIRYFELSDEQGEISDAWFGGGIDLTPYYLDDRDVRHFHKTLKDVCDTYGMDLYPKYKAECDRYFFNTHRNEARGVGGVFFDYLRGTAERPLEFWYDFTRNIGKAFNHAYLPIVEKHKDEQWTSEQREWQELRRGRYVEFNLIHDRGTLFGLKTNGRTESILMSLPPVVRWDYNSVPAERSEESKLLAVLQKPITWI